MLPVRACAGATGYRVLCTTTRSFRAQKNSRVFNVELTMRHPFVLRGVLRHVTRVGACCCALWSVGCADDGHSMLPAEAELDAGTVDSVGNGCAAWRSACCQYVSRCGKATPNCSAQFAAIQCLSETDSEHCAAQLREAKCGNLPVECQPSAIASSASAVAGCHQYVDAVCASAAHCGFDPSAAACVAMEPLDCSLAVGITARFDECMVGLQTVSCQSWVPPEACNGVVVVR